MEEKMNSFNFAHDTTLVHDYTMLAPKFFSRKMNISIDVLCNLFDLWIDAIQSMFNQNLIKHDALVGENSCHIRAMVLIDIHLKIKKNRDFKIILDEFIKKTNGISVKLRALFLEKNDERITIFEFLNKRDSLFFIQKKGFDDIKFIIDSYLLTITKEELIGSGFTLNEKTNYHFLSPFGFAKNKAKNIASCEYVKQEALLLESKALQYLLVIKRDVHERSFMPQFFVAKVLFQRALVKKYNIIVTINRYLHGEFMDKMSLYFKPNLLKTDFELCNTIYYDDPCIVLNGVVNYLREPEATRQYVSNLSSHSLLNIVYANFASHPQYSGSLKNIELSFDELIAAAKAELTDLENLNQYEKMLELNNMIHQIEEELVDFNHKKNFASEYGCCVNNPSLLFLNHIYADNPENHFDVEVPFIQFENLVKELR